MLTAYSALLALLYPIYRIAALFSPSLRHFQKLRQNVFRDLESRAVELRNRPLYWLHASSVGEMDQALAVAEEIRKRGPVWIVISAFSASVKKPPPEADLFFYLPLDFASNARRLVLLLRPRAFLTMTWDVWPNLLSALKKEHIPTYLCSAALARDSRHLAWPYAHFYKRAYDLFTGIGVVDEANAETFGQLVVPEKIRITGDSRYDRILKKLEQPQQDTPLTGPLNALQPGFVILASFYRPCDHMLFGLLRPCLEMGQSVLLFPHHTSAERLQEVEAHIRAQADLNDWPLQRLSRMQPRPATFTGAAATLGEQAQLILVDVLGLLAYAYRKASFCYVGGGLHHRIHNTGEPAACGIPILTGPRIDTSPVALALEARGALFRCRDQADFAHQFQRFRLNPEEARQAGQKGQLFIQSQAGASGRFCSTFLPEVHPGFSQKT